MIFKFNNTNYVESNQSMSAVQELGARGAMEFYGGLAVAGYGS